MSAPAPIRRLRALPPFRLDALLGLLLLVDAIVETELAGLASDRVPLAYAASLTIAAAVALRRRAPVLAVALNFTAILLAEQAGSEFVDRLIGPWFATLFVNFTAGYVLEGTRLLAATAIAVVLTVLTTFTGDRDMTVAEAVLSGVLSFGAPLLIGQLLANRTRLNEALRQKAVRAEEERGRRAESAALEERTRIAGELHDVVAHALSAMTVQAAAARRLAERDPARARAAFGSAEATGREALTELRRLLGVLRKEDEELALAPQPSLAHVADLVRRTAAAGLPTELVTEGAPQPLGAGVDLTAYRLVQEALAAARDAGGAGRAAVAVRYGAGDLEVEVTDDGGRRGRRLLGMRERVAVYGGELSAAPLAAGGWRVAAQLPLESSP
jgi:signal transduction histidine kinase